METGPGDFAQIRIELEAIQHMVTKSIMSRAEGLSALVDAEVEKNLTPERINQAIQEHIEREFEASLSYGEGRRMIRNIVEQKVKEVVQKLEDKS